MTLTGAVQPSNQGDTVRLANPAGQLIDQVAYTTNQAKSGRTLPFGRQHDNGS